MTIFPHLLTSSGLTQYEAADYLGVRRTSIAQWCTKRQCPAEILDWMITLIQTQTRMADATLDLIKNHPPEIEIEIGFCADNTEAQHLGLPTKSAHDAVIRRIIERIDNPLRLRFVNLFCKA